MLYAFPLGTWAPPVIQRPAVHWHPFQGAPRLPNPLLSEISSRRPVTLTINGWIDGWIEGWMDELATVCDCVLIWAVMDWHHIQVVPQPCALW